MRHLGSVCSVGRKHRELPSESLLNARGIGCGQTVLSAENPMSPICGLLSRRNLTEFGRVLSFCVWLHHYFTMGASHDVNAFFGRVGPLIAVPTGVTIFDWLFTMYRGRVQFFVPMLFTLAFIVTFVIGGMTGVLLAVGPVDIVLQRSCWRISTNCCRSAFGSITSTSLAENSSPGLPSALLSEARDEG